MRQLPRTDRRLRIIVQRFRNQPVLATFTLLTRWLLAAGFIPSGLKKVLNEPFYTGSLDSPIGTFFEAFFQATLYYQFVGLAQVVAGLLLLFPATALLGALLFLPVIANIVVITVSMGFRGTWILAILMLVANLYLLAWDWDRLRFLVGRRSAETKAPSALAAVAGTTRSPWRLAIASSILSLAGGSLFLFAGFGWVQEGLVVPALGVGVAMAPLAAAAWWHVLLGRLRRLG